MIKILTPLLVWKECTEKQLEEYILHIDKHSQAIKYEDKIDFLNSKIQLKSQGK